MVIVRLPRNDSLPFLLPTRCATRVKDTAGIKLSKVRERRNQMGASSAPTNRINRCEKEQRCSAMIEREHAARVENGCNLKAFKASPLSCPLWKPMLLLGSFRRELHSVSISLLDLLRSLSSRSIYDRRGLRGNGFALKFSNKRGTATASRTIEKYRRRSRCRVEK